MKNKLILNSILGLTIACPSFAAVDIAKNAEDPGCTNSVLKTYTGPTDLEADYTANTINLNFYSNENTVYSTGTCTYDGAITLPTTDPTRTGYTFDGWQVRRAAANNNNQSGGNNQTAFDLSTWNYGTVPSWDAQYTRWKSLNPENAYTMEDAFGTENSSDLSNGEWAITFGNGTVKGMSQCREETEEHCEPAEDICEEDPETGEETCEPGPDDCWDEYVYNCYCQATGYAEPNSSSYTPVASALWVFLHDAVSGEADDCAYDCAYYCAGDVINNDDFRRAVFGVAGN